MLPALRSIAVVVALALCAGAVLAWFAGLVAERAERNRRLAETQVLRDMVLSAGELPADFEGQAQGDLLLCGPRLAILRGLGDGYGGELRVAVAFGDDKRVQGMRVLAHGETPGFADILDADSAWLAGFRNMQPDVHAVTGATVTSQAVIDAVARVVERSEGDALSECFEPCLEDCGDG